MCVYFNKPPPAAGILNAPPSLRHPPPLEGRFQGCMKFGPPTFAAWILVVFVMSVVAVTSVNCLRRFRDSRRFRESHRVAKHRFSKT